MCAFSFCCLSFPGFDWRIEWWNQRGGITLLPAAIGLRQHGFAVLFHLCNERIRRAGVFVVRRPDEQFKENRSQGDALRREAIVGAATVLCRRFDSQNAAVSELLEAI